MKRTQPGYGRSRQSGFTIVELLVATAVFSVVLLLYISGLLQIGRIYYKGITMARTQERSRQVLDDISRHIQIAGGAIANPIANNGPSRGFCIGDRRYSYVLDKQLTDDASPQPSQSRNVLMVEESVLGCGSTAAQDVTSGLPAGRELLEPNMRLAKLEVANIAGSELYSIDIRIVYGDEDLLDKPPAVPEIACKESIVGRQFCAVSELRTLVKKRVK